MGLLECPCCGEPVRIENPRLRGIIINRCATINAELLHLEAMLVSSRKLRLSKQHNITQAGIDERCKALDLRLNALKAELELLEKMR